MHDGAHSTHQGGHLLKEQEKKNPYLLFTAKSVHEMCFTTDFFRFYIPLVPSPNSRLQISSVRIFGDGLC